MKRLKIFISILFVCIVGRVCAQNPGCDSIGKISLYEINGRINDGNWTRTLSTLGIRFGVKIGIDYLFNHTITELRPDGSDRHSFPSSHAIWSYGVAVMVGYNLVPYSPWWGVGAQAAANGIGLQRVMARRHYAGDVLAGAGIGIGVNLLSTCIGQWIWGSDNFYPCWKSCRNEMSPSIVVTTGADLTTRSYYGSYKLGTALSSIVRLTMPTSDNIGIVASFDISAAPVTAPTLRPYPLTSIGLLGGMSYNWEIDNGPFAIGIIGEAGYRYRFSPKGIPTSHSSIALRTALQPTLMLTRKFAIGAEFGYNYSSLRIVDTRHSLNAIYLSFLTRAFI